jgi:hypothetical protein
MPLEVTANNVRSLHQPDRYRNCPRPNALTEVFLKAWSNGRKPFDVIRMFL